MSTTTLAALVPLLPFLGAVAGLLTGRTAPGFARPLAVLPTVLATAFAIVVALRQGGGAPIQAATELAPTGRDALPVELALHLDGFAVLAAVLVGVVASCVQLYSTGYLRDDPRYAGYAAFVSLFTAAMLLVVYADDLIVLLVGWEVMGICSYFLVGHYWETHAARAASLKAFLVTKLGDVPFLIGVFVLATEADTFRISGIVGKLTSRLAEFELGHPTLIALLLLAGVAGKSAQFPLHTWLPDAMAGPTPVSALIHAATMVAAGVYVVARLLPVFAASTAALVVLAALAAVTIVGSALAALAQDDIKRVLAYSTIGQLAYMAGALAVSDRGAAVFHLLTHGAFKALLFLAAGVLIHAAGTNSLAAMSRLGGLSRRAPDAYWTTTIGLLALAAVPPFSGFFSKEAVLGAAEHAAFGDAHGNAGALAVVPAAGWIVLAAGLLGAFLTAAYATRLWLLAFRGTDPGTEQGTEPGAPEHPAKDDVPDGEVPDAAGDSTATGRAADAAAPATGPAVPAVMNIVLWVLALPSLALGLAYGTLPDWFDSPSLAAGSLAPSLTTSVLATGIALAGVVVTYGAWRHAGTRAARTPLGAVAAHPEGDPALSEAEAIATHEPAYGDIASAPDPADPGRLLLGPLHRSAAHGFRVDAAYSALFVRPTKAAARLVRFLDREVVDAYVRGAGRGPRLLGALVRRTQTGNTQTYLGALAVGSLLLTAAVVLVAAGTGGA